MMFERWYNYFFGMTEAQKQEVYKEGMVVDQERLTQAIVSEVIGIRCIYFKSSGKYYTNGEESYPRETFKGCFYPSDLGKRLRELHKLPGIQNGYWSDYFILEPEGMYPELVLPATVDFEKSVLIPYPTVDFGVKE